MKIAISEKSDSMFAIIWKYTSIFIKYSSLNDVLHFLINVFLCILIFFKYLLYYSNIQGNLSIYDIFNEHNCECCLKISLNVIKLLLVISILY